MTRKLYLALAALLLTISSAAAYADSITFTLNNANQFGSGNSTVTYLATVSAPIGNAAPVFLNGDSFNVAFPITLDDTDFFANSPLSLNPGDSVTFAIFTLSLPSHPPLFTYFGSFSILGGADGGGNSTLGTQDFSVTATPEPSSFMLLGTGITGLIAVARRKRWM